MATYDETITGLSGTDYLAKYGDDVMSYDYAKVSAKNLLGDELTLHNGNNYYSNLSDFMESAGYRVIKNADGDVLYYTKIKSITTDTGAKTYTEISGVENVQIDNAGSITEATVKPQGIGFTATSTALAMAGASALGYNIGAKIEEANPDFWDSILQPFDEWFVNNVPEGIQNFMVGLDDDGEVCTYALDSVGDSTTGVLDTLKDASIDAGVYNSSGTKTQITSKGSFTDIFPYGLLLPINKVETHQTDVIIDFTDGSKKWYETFSTTNVAQHISTSYILDKHKYIHYMAFSTQPFSYTIERLLNKDTGQSVIVDSGNSKNITYNNVGFYGIDVSYGASFDASWVGTNNTASNNEVASDDSIGMLGYLSLFGYINGVTVQDNAILPTKDNTVDNTYPEWTSQDKKVTTGEKDKDGNEKTGSKWKKTTVKNASGDGYGDDDTQTKAQEGDATETNVDTVTPTTTPTDPTIPSDDVGTPPTVPTPSGLTSPLGISGVYNPSQEQISAFSDWLWSENPITQLLQMFSNPMNAIIGLHLIYATPETGNNATIGVGYLNSGCTAPVVSQQYTSIDCGSISIGNYYGDVTDYAPYTRISLYLPFIGIVSLNTDDIIGSTINVKYSVDIYTGACLCTVNIKRDSLDGVLYQYSGNCAVQIPLTSGNYASVISGITSGIIGAVGTIASGGAIAPLVGGTVAGAMNMKTNVSRSGAIGSNVGAMGIKKPYLIIERPITAYAKNYNKYSGYSSNNTIVLSELSGYTRVKDFHLDGISGATETELNEIQTLLQGGVII